jgi:hypothetical protein
MNPLDIAKDIINLGSTAGLKKDVADLQAAKLRILTDELSQARTRISALEIENRQLRSQLQDFQPVQQPGDLCPYCRRPTGELKDIKPHMYLGPAGVKVHYYKCSNCGKEYDRQDS